jgi:hypothetical protein
MRLPQMHVIDCRQGFDAEKLRAFLAALERAAHE